MTSVLIQVQAAEMSETPTVVDSELAAEPCDSLQSTLDSLSALVNETPQVELTVEEHAHACDNSTSSELAHQAEETAKLAELRLSLSVMLEEEALDSIDEYQAAVAEKQLQLHNLITKGKGSSKPALTLIETLGRMECITAAHQVGALIFMDNGGY